MKVYKVLGVLCLCLALIRPAVVSAEGDLLTAAETPVVFDEGENHTDRGYNTSMNFWYVGGEVIFHAEDVTLPEPREGQRCLLKVQAVSPVTDAVDLVLRVEQDGEVTECAGDVQAQPGEGGPVQMDVSEWAGETVNLELAYVWAQSSLITVMPVTPEAAFIYEEIMRETELESTAPEEETAAEESSAWEAAETEAAETEAEETETTHGFSVWPLVFCAAAGAGLLWYTGKHKK